MLPTKIPSPTNLSPKPDKATKKGISDLTGPSADGRVLYLDLPFFKYGTNDKTHAAAFILSLVLLVTIIILVFLGLNATNTAWAERAFNWLGSAFLFVAGVAVGGKGYEHKPHHHNND